MKPSIMRRVILPVGIVILAFFVFAIMVKMRPHVEKKRPPRPHPTVSVITVELADQPIVLTGYGTVQAKRRIDVIPQVSGRIVEKSPSFEAGETIAKGDTLVLIEKTDYLQGQAQAHANLAQARLSLALAQQEATIARQEWERLQSSNTSAQSAPPSALVLHAPQLAQAQAAVQAAAAALALADANLARCTLIAPFDGRVLSADADAGQYLRAGNSIGALYAIDKAEIVVPMPAEDMSWIRTGANGTTTPAYAGDPVTIVADYAGQRFAWQGVAARLGGAVDTASRQVPVVVEIDNPFVATTNRPALLTGMFVTAEFTGNPPPGAVVIPRDALRPDNKVWVVTSGHTITIRQVQVTRAGVDEAVIGKGLAAGEMICTSNLQFVTEGLPVSLQGESR